MKELDQLTQELYSCVSFKKGENPDLEKLRTLFYGDGKLINNSKTQPEEFTVERFIQSVRQQIEEGNIEAFHEKEASGKTEVFGKVAHRFSTFEARFDWEAPAPFVVGVNCIQFIQLDGQWLITSMVWDDETESTILPS
ncbi:MAG: hypothetical protein LPK07_01545 [Hymenobacteraceae bacterium]|nr:hypothetical protein [Hymenobacteraceae bacterium]MDX5480344.1 hypothetical protein [Hymenobacteraceae bacterium]